MNLIQRIDALLPQTQCGKCGHAGCRPYAEGIARGETLDKCPPGGDETIAAIARLLGRDVLPLDTSRGPAPPQVAFIREAECIGCTKCIQACPVDAIVGAAKLMHTVIEDECTGCDLCVAPCPVDCIDLLPLAEQQVALTGDVTLSDARHSLRRARRDQARRRFEARNARLRRQQEERQAERESRVRPRLQPAAAASQVDFVPGSTAEDAPRKRARVEATMSRARLNRSRAAFGPRPSPAQQATLALLELAVKEAEVRLEAWPEDEASTHSEPRGIADAAARRRAKVRLAMSRAAWNKAVAANVADSQLAALRLELEQAERALASLENTGPHRP